MPFRLLIPRKLHDEMIAQAIAELPLECCGLFAGRRLEDAMIGQVEARYPLVNKAASPVEYFSEERSMLAADRDMRQRGLEILAVYHSHPTTAPVPSKKDLAQNYLGDVMHLIVSLQAMTPLVRAWWLSETDYTVAEWDLQEAGL